MINKIKYIVATVVLLSTFSCNEWLKVTPKNRVDGTALLVNTEGFNAALSGVYYNLTNNSLYGAALEFEMIDAMAGYWQILPDHNLYQYTKFNYTHGSVVTDISIIWTLMYANIAQCNHIIQSAEEVNKNDIEYYDVILGEAIGLRAFLHMELLKMYGPAIATKADMNKKAIPYRRKFDKYAIEFNTYQEVINLIREDLLKAAELLTEDPIDQLGREGNGNKSNLLNYNGVVDFRGARMNKYAVYALLARLEMMADNKTKALEYANMFITPEKRIPFRFTAKNEILEPGTPDLRAIKYSPEMIFSIYINKHYENTGSLLGYKNYQINNNSVLYPSTEYSNFYTTGDGASAADYRYKFWFEDSGNNVIFTKYTKPVEGLSIGIASLPEVCIIRLPEMYYIASECYIGIDNTKALKLLNTVRTTRGLDPITEELEDQEIMDQLIKEQQKEFFGEGKMFFLFKRLFRNIVDLEGIETQASQEIFVFPIPNAEYEFSPNKKPSK